MQNFNIKLPTLQSFLFKYLLLELVCLLILLLMHFNRHLDNASTKSKKCEIKQNYAYYNFNKKDVIQ